jgi:hypothetical protein
MKRTNKSYSKIFMHRNFYVFPLLLFLVSFSYGSLFAVDIGIPGRLIQKIEMIRGELSETAFRTHPSQLRNLETRATLLKKRIDEGDIDEDTLEQSLNVLRHEWLKAARSLAQEPLRTGEALPASVIDELAPIEVQDLWQPASDDPLGVSLRLAFRPSPDFADQDWYARANISSPWNVERSQPERGMIPIKADANQTWEFALHCPGTFLRNRRVVEAVVKLDFFLGQETGKPQWSRTYRNTFGDSSVPIWRVWVADKSGLEDSEFSMLSLLTRSFQEKPEVTTLPEGVLFEEVRAAPLQEFQTDPFFMAVAQESGGTEVWASSVFSLKRFEPKARLILIATHPARAWLDSGMLDRLEWRPLKTEDPDRTLFRTSVTVPLVPADHRLDLLLSGTEQGQTLMFSAQWENQDGRPLLLDYPALP